MKYFVSTILLFVFTTTDSNAQPGAELVEKALSDPRVDVDIKINEDFIHNATEYSLNTIEIKSTDCERLKKNPLLMAICNQDTDRVKELVKNEDITYEQYKLAMAYAGNIASRIDGTIRTLKKQRLRSNSKKMLWPDDLSKVDAKTRRIIEEIIDKNYASITVYREVQNGFVQKALSDDDINVNANDDIHMHPEVFKALLMRPCVEVLAGG